MDRIDIIGLDKWLLDNPKYSQEDRELIIEAIEGYYDRKKDTDKMVTFDKDKLKRFKQVYEACKTETFMFEGNEFLKGYAKYVIQYLEDRFKKG